MQKSIAVLYKNSDFISKDKMKVKDYLIKSTKNEFSYNKTVYETDNVKIYWVDTKVRNLNKFFRNNIIDVVISVENEEYWKLKKYQHETLFNKIKKEIDSTFEEITIYRIKYNWEEDKPSYKIIEEQILNCKVDIWGTYYKTKKDALIGLCEKLKEDNRIKQCHIEYSKQKIKEHLKQIEINNNFIKVYEALLEG